MAGFSNPPSPPIGGPYRIDLFPVSSCKYCSAIFPLRSALFGIIFLFTFSWRSRKIVEFSGILDISLSLAEEDVECGIWRRA
ncbi:hypothetical protein HMPREF0322_02353 [Desulfitobacterium hafniense DP7]|uniref:Uncharacterized protein n=1 Tax=Desulfitobacterium hafniense DP7 TaxID=537010 RepID=G9XN12_DESHA|nr:hypothetical protein HMPREF0322_02353 [Desulfitobacterium hafniense DP7]